MKQSLKLPRLVTVFPLAFLPLGYSFLGRARNLPVFSQKQRSPLLLAVVLFFIPALSWSAPCPEGFVEHKRTGECEAKKGSKAGGAKALELIQSSPVTLSFAVPKLSLGQLSPSNAYRLEFSEQRPVPGQGRDDNRPQAWQQAFTELVNDLAQQAFLQGAKMANRTLPTPLPRRELEAFISQLDYGNYVEVGKISRQQIERKYRDGRVEETLHLQLTFLVARQQLLNELAPPPTPTNFAGPKINPADFPSATTHVVKFENEAFPVTANVRGPCCQPPGSFR